MKQVYAYKVVAIFNNKDAGVVGIYQTKAQALAKRSRMDTYIRRIVVPRNFPFDLAIMTQVISSVDSILKMVQNVICPVDELMVSLDDGQ